MKTTTGKHRSPLLVFAAAAFGLTLFSPKMSAGLPQGPPPPLPAASVTGQERLALGFGNQPPDLEQGWAQTVSGLTLSHTTNNFVDPAFNSFTGQIVSQPTNSGQEPDVDMFASVLTNKLPSYPSILSAASILDDRYYFRVSGPPGKVDISVSGEFAFNVAPMSLETYDSVPPGDVFDLYALLDISPLNPNLDSLLNRLDNVVPGITYNPLDDNFFLGTQQTLPEDITNVITVGDFKDGVNFGQDINETITVNTGSTYEVNMNASVEFSYFGPGTIGAAVFIDPILTIAPGTRDAKLYSIQFSPGIAGDAGSTAAMLGVTLVGLAGLRRRIFRPKQSSESQPGTRQGE